MAGEETVMEREEPSVVSRMSGEDDSSIGVASSVSSTLGLGKNGKNGGWVIVD